MPSQPVPVRPAPPVPSSQTHRREYVPGHHRSDRDRGRDREPRPTGGAESGQPQVIGDYEIVRTLGTGSFGKVKRE